MTAAAEHLQEMTVGRDWIHHELRCGGHLGAGGHANVLHPRLQANLDVIDHAMGELLHVERQLFTIRDNSGGIGPQSQLTDRGQ